MEHCLHRLLSIHYFAYIRCTTQGQHTTLSSKDRQNAALSLLAIFSAYHSLYNYPPSVKTYWRCMRFLCTSQANLLRYLQHQESIPLQVLMAEKFQMQECHFRGVLVSSLVRVQQKHSGASQTSTKAKEAANDTNAKDSVCANERARRGSGRKISNAGQAFTDQGGC